MPADRVFNGFSDGFESRRLHLQKQQSEYTGCFFYAHLLKAGGGV